jgi:hypothetical protein
LASAANAVALLPHAWAGASYTENFTIQPIDWKGLDNGAGPGEWGPYGFSNTNNTTGASPAGEAGGTFIRTNERNYYADTALYGTLSENVAWGASGEIFVSAPSADNDVILGHFKAPPQDAIADELNHGGILLREFSATEWRFMARIRGDSNQQKDGNVSVVNNGAYKWDYNYDPGSKTVTAHLYAIGGGPALFTSTTPALDNGETFQGNSFGWTGGFSGAGAGQFMTAFLDATTYSTNMPKVNQPFNSSPANW